MALVIGDEEEELFGAVVAEDEGDGVTELFVAGAAAHPSGVAVGEGADFPVEGLDAGVVHPEPGDGAEGDEGEAGDGG
ncbi:MAG: hypothetical protein RI897_3101 [Verrucomicrobiota bacterium]